MKANVGTVDKIVRVIIGAVIIVLGIVYKSWWGVIGLIPILTALFGYCGLYSILGMSTCKSRGAEAK